VTNWYFRKKQPGDQNREPIHGEFFAKDAISEPGKALVREGIQNSLDASLDNSDPVLVRIFLSGDVNALEADQHSEFFEGAWDHFQAEDNGLLPKTTPNGDERCPFILFEDMNTEGLTGDVNTWSKPPRRVENHFYHFYRAEGQSDKGAQKRGSWGVGKTVFQRASRLSTVLGLTVREDDGRRLLMGKAVLRSHNVDDAPYQDGYLGVGPETEPNVVMPIDDQDIIRRYCEAFGILRGDDETGLSLVIPWYDPEITESEVVRAVLRDYFFPILTGQLEVMVETPSFDACLDRGNLETEVAKLAPEVGAELKPLIDLALWIEGVRNEDRFQLEGPTPGQAWKWDKALVPESVMGELQTLFRTGQRLAVRVPVEIRPQEGDSRPSFFDMYLVRDEKETVGRPTFIREGIIIADVRSARSRGVRAIVIAEDPPLAEFIRDAENPSHTDLDHARLRDKYKRGYKTNLEFVINGVSELVGILSAEERDEDKRLLSDFFSIPAPPESSDPEETGDPDPGDDPGNEPEVPTDPPPPRPKQFRVEKRTVGFSVVAGDGGAEVPDTLEIRVAYDIRRGKPLKKYNAGDFDLGGEPISLDPEPQGIEIVERSGNRIVAKITEPTFAIHVVGFDSRRQLYVKVNATGVGNGNS